MVERESSRERLELIPWSDFQKGIAPLWGQTDPTTIPIFNNPYGIIQYPESEWSDKILYFPARYIMDNTVVGYISIYNLSDCHIRPRGIYILPEFRGKGLGHRMQKAAWDLFPLSFYRAFIWSREENIEKFSKYSNMNIVPGGSSIWSEFSQLYMFFMYADRSAKPDANDIKHNVDFIKKHKEQYSLGGTNNLNVVWNNQDWSKYFTEHKGNYVQLNLELNF